MMNTILLADGDAVERLIPKGPAPAWNRIEATRGRCGLIFGLLWAVSNSGYGQTIPVPNASFESPGTTFVDTRIDFWQKAPKPVWYDESGGFLWDQLAGVFVNAAATNAAYIDNSDGNQGLYLFALPQMAVFQDYSSTDWTNSTPLHAFKAKFEVGKSYRLAVGVIGGGGNMSSGATMELALYYREASSNLVNVASTSITNTLTAFPNTTHYVDYSVAVPTVKASDAWAGQNIGISLASTVRPELASGYWDLDNVRLVATGGGPSLVPNWSKGRFQLTVLSDPGLKLELLSTTNIAAPVANWSSLATLTNTTGTVSFSDSVTNLAARFYQVRTLP